MMPEHVKEMMSRKLNGKGRYSPKIRSFALTLHFYSPKAYNYIRKTWKNLLPSPSAIKQWYRVVDGSPGFTKKRGENGDLTWYCSFLLIRSRQFNVPTER